MNDMNGKWSRDEHKGMRRVLAHGHRALQGTLQVAGYLGRLAFVSLCWTQKVPARTASMRSGVRAARAIQAKKLQASNHAMAGQVSKLQSRFESSGPLPGCARAASWDNSRSVYGQFRSFSVIFGQFRTL
jgi:hypothetical protein